MSRRRSTNPTVAISITLPRSQIDKLDRVLDIKSSRSAWISKAISERLDGVSQIERDLEDATVDDLLSWLLFHGAITNKERFRIANEFKDTESLRQQSEQP